MSVVDVVWVVGRLLCKPFKFNAAKDRIDQSQVATFMDGGVQRRLEAGEWFQDPSDGAICEIVDERPDAGSANESALRLQRDNPGKEYRICMSVGL